MWTYIYNTNCVTLSSFNYSYCIFHTKARNTAALSIKFRTKTYYLILKEKILLKIKNPTQKTLSIWNFNIITKTFVFSGSDCRLLKRRHYFMQICFIVNYFRARIVLWPFLLYDSYQLKKSFSRVFECVLCTI